MMSTFMNNDLLNQVTVKNTFVHVNSFCDTTDGSSTASEHIPSSQSSPGGNVSNDNGLQPPQLQLGRSNSAPVQQTEQPQLIDPNQQVQYVDQSQMAVVVDANQSFAAIGSGDQGMVQEQQQYAEQQQQVQGHENNAYIIGSTNQIDQQQQQQQQQQPQMVFVDPNQQQHDYNQQFQQQQYVQVPQQQFVTPMQNNGVMMMDHNGMMQQNISPSMVSPQECRVVYVQGNFAAQTPSPNTGSPQLQQTNNGMQPCWRLAPMFQHSNSSLSSTGSGEMFQQQNVSPLSSVPMVMNPQGVQGQIQVPQGNMVAQQVMPINMDELPSIGSAGHFNGTCKRCCFHPKGRCVNGAACLFCHFPHEKRVRRSKKSKRSRTSTNRTDISAGSPGLTQMNDQQQFMNQQMNMTICTPVQSPGMMMQHQQQPQGMSSGEPSPVCQNPNQLQF
jgi:hypothetical protein